MNRRVRIQKRVQTPDSWGQLSLAWQDVMTNVPAAFEELTGAERLHAQQRMGDVTHKITLRYHPLLALPSVVDSWRLLYANRFFDINYCMNVNERNRTMELFCTEGLNDGQ